MPSNRSKYLALRAAASLAAMLRQRISLFSQPKNLMRLCLCSKDAFPRVALLLIVLSAQQIVLEAAFNGSMQWDVRTTGADTNGGGFDPGVVSPGTDFSQQDSAQISYTDIIVGATTTQGTSVLHPFDSTIPGNVVNITAGAGCTVQRAEVLSVSGTTATFDKSLGTAASTCTGALGGSLLTVGKAAGLGVSQNVINIKAGTYTISATITIATSQLSLIGYNATHGDRGTAPLITTATNSVHLFSITVGVDSGSGDFWSNLSLSNTAATRFDGIAATSGYGQIAVDSCTFDGFRFGINGGGSDGQAIAVVHINRSEIKNSTTDGVKGENAIYATYNYIHNNTGIGINDINTGGYSLFASGNIVANNGGAGVVYNSSNSQYGAVLTNNTITGNTGNGVTVTSNFPIPPGVGLTMVGNIIYNNGGWGVSIPNNLTNPPGAVVALYSNNAYGSNTSGNQQNFTASRNDVTLTANPFTNSGSGNYSLNSTTGGGAALKQAGFPGIFPGGSSTGYLDIGAVQTSGTPGTGGVSGGAFVQ